MWSIYKLNSKILQDIILKVQSIHKVTNSYCMENTHFH